MKIVFMGTPDFAVEPLKALVSSPDYEVIAVVCNHDKPVGRKQVLTAPPVKEYANSVHIPVYQYDKIRLEGVEDLKKLNPDLIVTCAFGQILSQEIIDIPKLGVINIHASLLPKYRGASPIHYAILNGEKTTGVTIMKTDIGIDTGDILISEQVEIGEQETCGELFDRLSVLGANLIIKALNLIKDGKANFTVQDHSKSTTTKIIKKEMAKIDFTKTANEVVNQIRAFNPSPIAFTFFNGEQYKIYKAQAVEGNGQSGEIINSTDSLIIACGSGAISVETIQRQGGKPLNIKDFLRGNKLPTGETFTNA
ncbi:MAG: methionyl-tRNA formyltransferase [Clostridia bacterium]|nr:methionyl-tRNA formyltransferase [Clostridia bacterium]